MAQAYIGTSGWQYRHWKKDFYGDRPQRLWLEYASSQFSSLEIDGTFYRLQQKETFAAWADRVPDDFRFAIRGHRYTTHQKRLIDPIPTIEKQVEPASGLGDKLAVVLWQLPPFFKKDAERLAEFLRALTVTWPGPRHAIEFRHESWFVDEIAEMLADFKAANTISDAGAFPRWDAVTTDLVYVRLHGKPHTYSSGYEETELSQWADKVRKWFQEKRQVHFYFDNDAKGRAPIEALELIRLCR